MSPFKVDRLNRLSAAAVGGLAGGVGMALVATIRSSATGLGFWLPVQSVAATFMGVDALIEGTGAVALGLALHVAVAVVAGLVFGAVLADAPPRPLTLGLALAYGVFIWAAMTFLILPLVNDVMLERVLMAPTWWFVQHVIYGLMLGVSVVFFERRGLKTKRERDPEDHALRPLASVD